MNSKKIAVFFPGIGYSVDRPLLYYSRKMFSEMGYETKLISYSGFPENIRGDKSKMVRAYSIALKQAQEMLADIDLAVYDEVLFIGKSIGTIVGATIAGTASVKKPIRQILYTPLEATFNFKTDDAIAFTGTADPWVGGTNSRIADICAERGIPCHVYDGANHSLETGDWRKDLAYLQDAMRKTEEFIRG